jgi:hypothetical protein
MMRRNGGRARRDRRRASIATVLARPAVAGVYPGYRVAQLDHRTRTFVTGAALLHATVIAVLIALASLAPRVEDKILFLQILHPEPEPPPVVEPAPKPEPPPKPVQKVEIPKPPPPKPPPPKPEPPKAEPRVAPKPPPKPAPPKIEPAPAPTASVAPPPARVARAAPARPSALVVPAAQIDRMAVRPELPEPVRDSTHRASAPRSARSEPRPPAAIDRVEVARPKPAPAAPALVASRPTPPPRPERTARPESITHESPAPRTTLRGVALSELLPCVSDAREVSLKQETVAAARNRAVCESPAGRFHFVETKNVNAFLMRIEQAPGRRSGDRCEALRLALDCIASLPPRSRP